MYLGELTRHILLDATVQKLLFGRHEEALQILRGREVFQTRHISESKADEVGGKHCIMDLLIQTSVCSTDILQEMILIMGDVHLQLHVDYQIVPNPHLKDLLDHAQLEKLSNNDKIIFSLLNLIIEKVTGQDSSDIWFCPGPSLPLSSMAMRDQDFS